MGIFRLCIGMELSGSNFRSALLYHSTAELLISQIKIGKEAVRVISAAWRRCGDPKADQRGKRGIYPLDARQDAASSTLPSWTLTRSLMGMTL